MPLLLPMYETNKLAAVHKKMGEENKWEDLKLHDLPQDFADMLGWKEMTKKTEAFYKTLPDSTKATGVVLCSHYGYASSLKFYGEDTSFTKKVISTSGSFVFWADLPASLQHLIFVGTSQPEHELFDHFKTVQIIDSVINPASPQFGDKIFFYKDLDSVGQTMFPKALEQLRSKFIRG